MERDIDLDRATKQIAHAVGAGSRILILEEGSMETSNIQIAAMEQKSSSKQGLLVRNALEWKNDSRSATIDAKVYAAYVENSRDLLCWDSEKPASSSIDIDGLHTTFHACGLRFIEPILAADRAMAEVTQQQWDNGAGGSVSLISGSTSFAGKSPQDILAVVCKTFPGLAKHADFLVHGDTRRIPGSYTITKVNNRTPIIEQESQADTLVLEPNPEVLASEKRSLANQLRDVVDAAVELDKQRMISALHARGVKASLENPHIDETVSGRIIRRSLHHIVQESEDKRFILYPTASMNQNLTIGQRVKITWNGRTASIESPADRQRLPSARVSQREKALSLEHPRALGQALKI